MRLRFQADAKVNPQIGRGVCDYNSEIDYQQAVGFLTDGLADPDVLAFAADQQRVLVTGYVRTMPTHFQEFRQRRTSSGLILRPRDTSVGDAIRGLLYAWQSWSPEEINNQQFWLPRLR